MPSSKAHLRSTLWLCLWAFALGACRDLKPDPGYCPDCTFDAGPVGPGVSDATQASTAAGTQSMGQAVSAAGAGVAAVQVASAGARATTGASMSVAGQVGMSSAGRTAAGTAAQRAGTIAASGGAGNAGGGGSTAVPERDAGTGTVTPPGTNACGRECGGDTPICDESWNNCVQCTAQNLQYCSGELRACDLGVKRCVECTSDDHCSGDMRACDTQLHRCVECTSDETCPPDKPVCDIQAKRCITCMRNRPDSCGSALPVCDEAAQKCVECMPGQMQACRGNRAQCDAASHSCVECLMDSHCPNADHPACDLKTHTCVGCMGQTTCRERFPATPVCDMSSRACVQCAIDSDCSNGQRCNTSKHSCEAMPQMPTGTLMTCDRCDSETQCAGSADKRATCASAGGVKSCFPSAQGQCEPGFRSQGVNGGNYCLPVNNLSCEAIKAIGASCTQQQSQCSAGTECQMDHCTIRCTESRDCPKGSCVGQGGERYCL